MHLIAGGRGKGSDYSPLAAPVQARCAGVYLIGETAAALHEALLTTGVPSTTPPTSSAPSARPVPRAQPGDVVLLSPGCASYDQYRSYEQRGDHFRALVECPVINPEGVRPVVSNGGPMGRKKSSSRWNIACCSPPRSACWPAVR